MGYLIDPYIYGVATDFTVNLIAGWQFEDDLTDYTTNHDGTGSGTPTFEDGKVDRCMHLSGVSQYVTISDHNDLSFTDGSDTAHSWAFWVNPDSHSSTIETIFWKGGGATDREYRLQLDSASGLWWRLMTPTTNYIGINYNSGWGNDTWFHVVLTYDGSESETGLTMYINGSDISGTQAESGTYTGMVNSSIDLSIGTRTDIPTSNEMHGELDELKLWSYELSAAEALELYNLENAGTSVLP